MPWHIQPCLLPRARMGWRSSDLEEEVLVVRQVANIGLDDRQVAHHMLLVLRILPESKRPFR